MYKLIIQDDEGKTTVVPLIRDEITIGRKEGNTIRLTERNVSRRHARLVKASGNVVIEDLDSYNGIRVNGTRIQGRVSVAETDRIQIGDYLLELKLDRQAQATNGSAGTATGPFEDQRTLPMERGELPGAVPSAPLAPGATVPTGPPSGMVPAPTAAGSMPPTPPAAAMQPAMAKTLDPTSGTPAVGGEDVKAPPRVSGPNAATDLAVTPVPPAAAPLAQAVESPARLVCMSTNFAGREFSLDKAAMVIGRTDDNDVVVNHRSISRHHAKIVREHGRYAIVDLQSSNGVRVNGEEYGKVELRRGDLIDLGHVRLRFVEPGEDFVFNRDGSVVDLSTEGSGKNRTPIYIGLAALVVAAVGVFVVFGGSKKATTATAVASPDVAPTTKEPVVSPPVLPDAGTMVVGPNTPVDAPKGDVLKKLDTAKASVDKEDWSGALAAAEAALALDPGNEEARRIANQARSESAAQTVYEDLQKAVKAKKIEEAARLLQKLPEGSVYRIRANGEIEKQLDTWLAEQRTAASTLADRGKCEQITPIAKKVSELYPQKLDVIEAVQHRCVPPGAATPKPPREKPPIAETPKEPTPKEPKEPPVAKEPVVDETAFAGLADEAKKSYLAGQYGQSLRKAEDALAMKPGDQAVLTTATMSACRLKKVDTAKKYAGKLAAARRNMVKNVCAEAGVDL
jgi:pSer/pThr/pTyr-binding forkhead associated (FHA) protein/tetratricopeptide (TPR) repeat protein